MSLQMKVELKHPFSILTSGGSGAGKSTFSKLILKHNKNDVIAPSPEIIMWCYTKKKPDLLKELLSIDPKIQYIQGIPNDIETMFVRSINNMIILDGLVDQAIY